MLENALVFSDLDGTLLDHHTYSFAAALPMLDKLKSQQIPVIPNTSKTFAELTEFTEQLDKDGPFIVENGAAIYIPIDFFKTQPADFFRQRSASRTQTRLGAYQGFPCRHLQHRPGTHQGLHGF